VTRINMISFLLVVEREFRN